MSSKRPAGALSGMLAKKAREDGRSGAAPGSRSGGGGGGAGGGNPYLARPDNPERMLKLFLLQARTEGRRAAAAGPGLPLARPLVEIEARIGILKSPFGAHEMRVASSGPKRVSVGGETRVANAFLVSTGDEASGGGAARRPHFEGGITRSHYVHWTGPGLSEPSPISAAFGLKPDSGSADIKRDLAESESIETVYGGYAGSSRVCFPGDHHSDQSASASASASAGKVGKMEQKVKLTSMDVALPAAPYDLRLTLATEKTVDSDVHDPPKGWTARRLKRRRSYVRRDKSFAWQLDVTEVTSTENGPGGFTGGGGGGASVLYEVEIELTAASTLKLVNEEDATAAQRLCHQLAGQLWWMLGQINPAHDVLDPEEFLRDHPDADATRLALAQCGALKRYIDSGKTEWASPIGSPRPPAPHLSNSKFIGCMPVNFQRHNIDEIQRSEENGHFCSEKTDGVRYLMVFTGKTVVLVDRSMKGKQPVPCPGGAGANGADPLSPVLPLIQPGTVLDGEVVMHRRLGRPVFIVFDVLAISTSRPVLHLPFEERLRHLRQASFRTADCQTDMFAKEALTDRTIALPLVRKNFVKRTDLDDLLSNVIEERGIRAYRSGELHNHLTDGIIFQPNLPYKCGTDINLLKWKYLDTVTIDVEILPNDGYRRTARDDEDEDVLRVGVLGEEGTMVDMTRFIKLPPSERRRLEADRHENRAKIAEVGFDPTTGEWYYLTMRPDKIASNHISTVLGTLLELAESLSTEELRYRMSVPPGSRDTYRKDIGSMQRQLLTHQRARNKQARQQQR